MSSISPAEVQQMRIELIAREIAARRLALVTTALGEVAAAPIEWLWPQRFAIGKLSLIAGDPGLGKSQLAAWLAAIVTSGGAWPCGEGCAQAGSVVMLSAEDGLADTVRPRLEASGADVARVHVVEAVPSGDGRRAFSLGADLDRLAATIRRIGDVRLITIDPITAYLSAGDSHRAGDVRTALMQVQALAAEHRFAVVGITHLNKGGARGAMSRVTGSLAFVAAARAVFVLARTDEADRRLFLPVKNNLDGDTTGLAFRIESREIAAGIAAPRIAWEAERIVQSADELLAARPPEHGSPALARDFLLDILRGHPRPAREVFRIGADAGFTERQLRTAARKLDVTTGKSNMANGGWVWALPPQSKMTSDCEDDHSGNGHLRSSSITPAILAVPEGA